MSRRLSRRRLGRWLRGELDQASLLGLGVEARADLLWQAYRRLEAGQVAQAERLYQLIDTLWPGDASARLGLGACRQALGDLAGAEAAYGLALTDRPDDAYALANRAEVRLLTSRPEAARADLEAARAWLARADGPADLRERVEALWALADGEGSPGGFPDAR
ncbi:MAG: hypothetical protein IRY99_13465 [Isosphaeraceae bacterium]|nr:hypothetical protein [Isosphaeraceae bacterium]